jgi:hypothetical protein
MSHMSHIDGIKSYLIQLVKSHIYMETGTRTEVTVFNQINTNVNRLLQLGVPEMEIRSIIERAQVYDGSRPIPRFATRRYIIPSHQQEIERLMQESSNDDGDYEEEIVALNTRSNGAMNRRTSEGEMADLSRRIREIDFEDDDFEDDDFRRTRVSVAATNSRRQALATHPVIRIPSPPFEDDYRRQALATPPVIRIRSPRFEDDFEDDFRERRVSAAAIRRPAAAAASAVASATGHQMPSYLNEDDEDIDSKDLDEYKHMIKCPVCIGNIKDVRLSPCGHMMCKSCMKDYMTRRDTECPICKKQFTSFDKVYYNKYLKYKNKYLQLKTKSF